MELTHIFIDMDGVLTDLDSYFKKNFQGNPYHFTREWRRNFMVAKTNYVNERMFANLEPNPNIKDFHKLVNHMKERYIKVGILTSLGNMSHRCDIYNQKKEWLDKNGFENVNYLAVQDCNLKSIHAHPGAALIDDKMENCESFTFNSGQFALQYNMKKHKECFDVLYQELGIER